MSAWPTFGNHLPVTRLAIPMPQFHSRCMFTYCSISRGSCHLILQIMMTNIRKKWNKRMLATTGSYFIGDADTNYGDDDFVTEEE